MALGSWGGTGGVSSGTASDGIRNCVGLGSEQHGCCGESWGWGLWGSGLALWLPRGVASVQVVNCGWVELFKCFARLALVQGAWSGAMQAAKESACLSSIVLQNCGAVGPGEGDGWDSSPDCLDNSVVLFFCFQECVLWSLRQRRWRGLRCRRISTVPFSSASCLLVGPSPAHNSMIQTHLKRCIAILIIYQHDPD